MNYKSDFKITPYTIATIYILAIIGLSILNYNKNENSITYIILTILFFGIFIISSLIPCEKNIFNEPQTLLFSCIAFFVYVILSSCIVNIDLSISINYFSIYISPFFSFFLLKCFKELEETRNIYLKLKKSNECFILLSITLSSIFFLLLIWFSKNIYPFIFSILSFLISIISSTLIGLLLSIIESKKIRKKLIEKKRNYMKNKKSLAKTDK